eukprot:5185570-Amphidinium_carterae.3
MSAREREKAKVGPRREDIPACVQTFELGIQFPQPLPSVAGVSADHTVDEILFIDGSGKHISGETTKISYPLPGCWQSVSRTARYHACM